jgi:hypothetical protein
MDGHARETLIKSQKLDFADWGRGASRGFTLYPSGF